jgi:hypothetical protein
MGEWVLDMKQLKAGIYCLCLLLGLCGAPLCTALLCAAPLCAEERPALEIAPLTQAHMDLLFDSLRSSSVLALPALKSSQEVDPNISGVWSGSKTKVSLSMSEVTLRFRRKVDELVAAAQTGKDLTHELLESFDVVVKATPYRVELRHSHAESAYDSEGLWVPAQSTKPKTLAPFISGQKDSGVYIAVLPIANRDSEWAAYVCPRKTTQERGRAAVRLSPSMYELFEAKVSVAAEADVRMSTAGQEGKVKVSLDLSKDLPPSSLAEDESVSTAPRALFKYKPEAPSDFFRFKPQNNVQQGALVMVEMHNKAGYVRRQFFSRYLYIHKTEEQTGFPVFVGSKRATTDTGECYVVVEQASSWTEYDKKPATF